MGHFKDLTGQTFNYLHVDKLSDKRNKKNAILWDCTCNKCGGKIAVTSYNLTHNKVKSCGCLTHEHRYTDLTGQVFGRLTVVGLEHIDNWIPYWKCKCSCSPNSYTTVRAQSLMSGRTKSCGCNVHTQKYGDLTGKKFGRLLVLAREGTQNGHVTWWCKCDCDDNKIVIVKGIHLLSGHTKSCGCYKAEVLPKIREQLSRDKRNYPQWFINELYYDEDKQRAENQTLTSLDMVYFNCEIHGKYLQRVGDHMRNNEKYCGCRYCSHNIAQSGSKAELEARDYILNLTNLKIKKERILDIHDGGQLKEIDMYIKELSLGIEYNGSKFHATKNGVFDDKPKLYHQKKFLAAKEQGIHLISIFDVDWNTNKDKIKMYLKSLVVQNKKVFARKCELKSVDKREANTFTDKYHLQGHARLSSINYGLYCNDELLSVMSFGKLRLKKSEEGQYELHRYCVKDGYTIVGGANRLLKAFEREYSPKYLLSFSDNDYFMGGIYEKLNFANKGQSTPRYYWFLNGAEIKREKCQLKYLKRDFPELLQEAYDTEASNKEDYVMIKLGACKVYRSGNTRWVKDYTS